VTFEQYLSIGLLVVAVASIVLNGLQAYWARGERGAPLRHRLYARRLDAYLEIAEAAYGLSDDIKAAYAMAETSGTPTAEELRALGRQVFGDFARFQRLRRSRALLFELPTIHTLQTAVEAYLGALSIGERPADPLGDIEGAMQLMDAAMRRDIQTDELAEATRRVIGSEPAIEQALARIEHEAGMHDERLRDQG
jgi:hypothetical protein